MRLLGASAATAVLGLGTAGHAFASGAYDPSTAGTPASAMAIPGASEPEPPPIPGPDPFVPGLVPNPGPGPVAGPSTGPGIEPPPDSASTPESEPATASDGEPVPTPPEITTTTDSDGGNLNVSVRIDSPGTDGQVTQENGDGSVVSPPTAPDITPAEPVAGVVAPDPAQEPTHQQPTQSGSTNTNVSVRVLSPGDNGAVNQDNGGTAPPQTTPPLRAARHKVRTDSLRIRRSITTPIRSINPAILLTPLKRRALIPHRLLSHGIGHGTFRFATET